MPGSTQTSGCKSSSSVTSGAPVGPLSNDFALSGGGLQNCLVALAVLHRRPDAHLLLVEKEQRLAGNHTWCFHAGDVGESASEWLDPVVAHRWPGYEVRFPSYRRRLPEAYRAVTSARLRRVAEECLARAPNARVLRARVDSLSEDGIRLNDGSEHRAKCIVDARGPQLGLGATRCAYQKFLGLELRLAAERAPPEPVLMDATVEQTDGFRFVYVLPFSPTRVLVEDTYYSDGPKLDRSLLRQRVLEYADRQGWPVREVLREEAGVLPIPLSWQPLKKQSRPLSGGYAGGYFHPTTGYSLPVAVRLAECGSQHPEPSDFEAALSRLRRKQNAQARFCVALNRLLFGAFQPERRYQVLERFYRLPVQTIRRFYALQLTSADRARIVCGRPPRGFSARRLLETERAIQGAPS